MLVKITGAYFNRKRQKGKGEACGEMDGGGGERERVTKKAGD